MGSPHPYFSAMDFFEHQDQARRNTSWLIVLFGLAIATMILTFYIVALVLFQNISPDGFSVLRPDLFLLVMGGTLGVICFGTLTKMIELRRGGPAVAEGLGGREVQPQTNDFKEQQLLNVVAEMALASGTPIPKVYLLEHEAGINAFAAGYAPDDAVIGVTRGCIEQLTREELQGVIAHEFSHILNGDMRLNLNLMGVVQGLLFIYILGRMLTDGSRPSRHNRDADARGVLIGVAMMIIGGIGLFFGRLIKSSVSRQREFLADASSVQFTRNPEGLAGALRRIGGFTDGSRLRSPKAEEASHMFFGAALKANLAGNWMATHPPLKERIRRIMGLEVTGTPTLATAGMVGFAEANAMGLHAATSTQGSPAMPPAAAPSASQPDRAATFMATVGTATPQHLAKAHDFLQSLPTAVSDAVRSPAGAMALIYAMLLDQQPEVRSQQLRLFQQPDAAVSPQHVQQLSEFMRDMDARIYLPLLDLSVPVLRTITPPQCARFFKDIQALVKADGKLSVSEYVLQIILQKRLRPYFQKPLKHPKAVTSLEAVWPDCQILLTILARIGHQTPEDIIYAFKSGASRLPGANQRELPQTLPKVTLSDLGQSLKHLEPVVPKLKQAIVDAAAHTVMLDNAVTLKEAELLRAIVITLDCPIPPFLEAPAKPAQKPKTASLPVAQNGHRRRPA
jgi:Zn-dependent protease with chaperone function